MIRNESELPRREREILDAMFELGDDASAEEIRAKLASPPSYSAVRAMLARLETKGLVRHKEKGLRYVYSPTRRRATARRSALQRLIRVFFDGSPGEAVTALIDGEKWSAEELDEMMQAIQKKKDEKKKESGS
ncbi:MAG TPA: BlaI/MecI/CopY family transcriptional regulator [Thermoanaerobaculia bacterium]|nr:BlaI/MecI/CopY family transcriptional regulator [Thermoanaerobaculia bacterium]